MSNFLRSSEVLAQEPAESISQRLQVARRVAGTAINTDAIYQKPRQQLITSPNTELKQTMTKENNND